MNTLIARTLILIFLTVAGLQAQEPPAAAADCWEERVNAHGTTPSARSQHTAVWTGSEMIVWGGAFRNTGGRYNPATNSWTAVTTTGAPAGRALHTAVWTGREMIVWDGTDGNPVGLRTGGRYNPADDSWVAVTTTGAPAARWNHTAVWTGSEMIVWGGTGFGAGNTGGRYNPADDSWVAVTTTGAPAARYWHTAVWTGSEMIVWGGYDAGNTGGRYNPVDDSWTPVTTTGAPAGRLYHTAVWTGTEMIVWGGETGSGSTLNTGGRYNPEANSWTAVSTTGAPAARSIHTAVWTGSEMIVWGGNHGPWHTAGPVHNTGGRYDPAGNRWAAVRTSGAPPARSRHSAVWAGREMIVWGGSASSYFNDTFSYSPGCEAFRINSAVLDNGNLALSFPTVTGRAYTLWRSDTLTSGTWTNTGLAALAGTGATLTFTLPAPAAGVPKRFFRVQADP